MFFRRKKPITTVYFDIGGVVVDAPMDRYREQGMELFGCRDDHLVLGRVLAAARDGKDHFDRVLGESRTKLAFMGMGRVVPAWRFKGFWESIMVERLRVHDDVLSLVASQVHRGRSVEHHQRARQRAAEPRAIQNFSPVVLSCQVSMRKPNLDIYKEGRRDGGLSAGATVFWSTTWRRTSKAL